MTKPDDLNHSAEHIVQQMQKASEKKSFDKKVTELEHKHTKLSKKNLKIMTHSHLLKLSSSILNISYHVLNYLMKVIYLYRFEYHLAIQAELVSF